MASALARELVAYLRREGHEPPPPDEMHWAAAAALDQLSALSREERLRRLRARDACGLSAWHHALTPAARVAMMEYVIWCIDF